MKNGKIALRYARAFFDFANEKGILEETRADMALVDTVFRENKDFRTMLNSPVINVRKKESIMREIFAAHCNKASTEFILLLTRNKREEFLGEIARVYEILYREHKGIVTVKLTTAIPVTEAIRNDIIRLVSEGTGAQVELEEGVDPELIGGFVLRFDDKKYDASIKRELDKLKKEFDINLYIRVF